MTEYRRALEDCQALARIFSYISVRMSSIWMRIETLTVSYLLKPNDLPRLASVLCLSENELFSFVIAGAKLVVIAGTPKKHGFVLEQWSDDTSVAELLKL